MSKAMPSLIVGGAPKSGTTAIYYYMRQHPDICLSEKKELHFFSRPFLEGRAEGPGDRYVLAEIPGTFEEYLSFFQQCSGKVAVDISPSYLFHYRSAEGIKRSLGNVRIVFILRNPVDKAFSQYMHLVGAGREILSFEEALAIESDREVRGFADMWLYRASGYYAHAIDHYRSVFGPENLRVFYYEEFMLEPERTLREICAFAGADPQFRFKPVSDINRSGRPRSAAVAKLLGPSPFTFLLRRIFPRGLGRAMRKAVKEWNTGARQVLSEDIRRLLLEGYRDDILRTESMVGRESGWLN